MESEPIVIVKGTWMVNGMTLESLEGLCKPVPCKTAPSIVNTVKDSLKNCTNVPSGESCDVICEESYLPVAGDRWVIAIVSFFVLSTENFILLLLRTLICILCAYLTDKSLGIYSNCCLP